MKYLYNILYKSGVSLFIFCFMFTISIILVSYTQKGKINYGNRCNAYLDTNFIEEIKFKEIIAYDYELQCNTLYLEMNADNNLNENELVALLLRINYFYNSNNLELNTQVTLKNENYLILASIIKDSDVYLTISNL